MLYCPYQKWCNVEESMYSGISGTGNMGQYQQWLRYQEIDNSLRKTRQALEEELAQLESQLDTVFFEQQDEDEYPLNGNPIISALFASLESPDAYMPDQPYM